MNSMPNNAALHPIRAKENALFEEWIKAPQVRYPFAVDGCADPAAFERSRYRIVLTLKERNWGHTIEEQRAFAAAPPDLPTRLQEMSNDKGRETFDSWWTLVAQWVEVLLATESVDWPALERSFALDAATSDVAPRQVAESREAWVYEKNKMSLGKCSCVQLKKVPGGGTMNKYDFNAFVKEDKDFILRQFGIYSPHFIISCGSNDNWGVFSQCLFPDSDVQRTRNGVMYFIASSSQNGLCKTAVINFGHPSMRINSSLWGVLAFGLRDALDEINSQHSDLGSLAE